MENSAFNIPILTTTAHSITVSQTSNNPTVITPTPTPTLLSNSFSPSNPCPTPSNASLSAKAQNFPFKISSTPLSLFSNFMYDLFLD
jgi:hypothetical protein